MKVTWTIFRADPSQVEISRFCCFEFATPGEVLNHLKKLGWTAATIRKRGDRYARVSQEAAGMRAEFFTTYAAANRRHRSA